MSIEEDVDDVDVSKFHKCQHDFEENLLCILKINNYLQKLPHLSFKNKKLPSNIKSENFVIKLTDAIDLK